MKSLIV